VNDIDDVLMQARDSLPAGRIADPPPVAKILARSRGQRHRRQLAGVSAAGIAGVAVLALGLAGVFGGHSPARAGTTIRTAAFTLAENANGTATLTLTQDQVFNPSALEQALQQDGIPALVETGSYCSSNPAPAGGADVLSIQLPDGTPIGPDGSVPPDAVTVINPAAMPAGTELFFGYFNNSTALVGSIIYTGSYTCSSSPPAPSHPAK
jgi:hypothetical protein